MRGLEADADGLALLSAIGFRGIEPATDADWDGFRALGITEAEANGH